MQNIKNKINNLLKEDPFGLDKSLKEMKIVDILKLQIYYHRKNCSYYNTWYTKNNFLDPQKIKGYEDIPYLPSRIFKNINLKSTKLLNKVISSSGSTGQNKSIINIDSITSNFQKINLSKILSNTLNKKRRPFFIVDLEPREKFNQNIISARYAGMSGYLMAATSKNYLLKLDDNNKIIIDFKKIIELKKIINKEPIVLIGYTFMLWSYLLKNNQINLNKILCHNDTKIIHFGGWKKLENKKVNKKIFINRIQNIMNIDSKSILDIYGFSEQLGAIYVSNGLSGFRVNSYSHILIRDPKTFKVAKDGDAGFMQFLSVTPLSYPGFSILNDDIGYISSRKMVKNIEKIEFKINSRLDKLEARGCGDTLPNNYYI